VFAELSRAFQFALAHWLFWDAAILSAHAHPPADAPHDTVPVHVAFLDWIPGICSTLGLLVVNIIDKERLVGEGAFGQDPSVVWRARLFLFVGFALMAGGLAGSVVRTPLTANFRFRLTRSYSLEYLGTEVHPSTLRGEIRLLRLCERITERRPDALGHRPLACPAYFRRV
jgi:hypothetical protein